jgi:hypothetical protein
VCSSDLNCNTKKEMILLSLHIEREMRTNAINKLAVYLHLDEPVSMTQIITYAQNQVRKNLIDYQEKFADLITRIEKVNTINKNLITFSLANVSNTINYIDSLTLSSPNYGPSGHIKAGNLQGRLISQAG